jgi:hydrogenase maturation protease
VQATGAAIHVFHRLREARHLPAHVKVFDAGIAGFSAIDYFEGCTKAIVVDAMKGSGQIGSVHRLQLEDLNRPEQWCSMHVLGVEDNGRRLIRLSALE